MSLAWLAGLIEGEGTFGVSRAGPERRYCRFRISVQMTDLDVIERAHAIAGVGAIYGPYGRADNRQAQWRWSVDKRAEVVALAPLLKPLMGKRRQKQIETMLAAELESPRRFRPSPHGAHRRYKHHGCRCDLCRAENARVSRAARARRKAARLREAA